MAHTSTQVIETDQTPRRVIHSDKTRQAIYIGLMALLAIGTTVGVITEEQATQLGAAVTNILAFLGLGLAAANKPEPHEVQIITEYPDDVELDVQVEEVKSPGPGTDTSRLSAVKSDQLKPQGYEQGMS